MKRNHHKQKIKSLKIRLYEIEKLLEKMTRRSKCQVKSFFKGWVGWWAYRKRLKELKKKDPFIYK